MLNIILIGMPGSGKSTVGVILAKHCGKGFIDTDLLIQAAAGRTLQDVVDNEGYLALRKLEEEVFLGLRATDTVIATGGSAVYSRPAMEHLKSAGIVVFLDADLPTLRSRVNDFGSRGLAKRPDQSFEQLYDGASFALSAVRRRDRGLRRTDPRRSVSEGQCALRDPVRTRPASSVAFPE